MKIEQLASDRILISLGEKDLAGYSMTFDTLDLKEETSRRMIRELLRLVAEECGLSMRNKRILIEAMQYDKGCLLLLTFSDKCRRRKVYHIKHDHYSITFAFRKLDHLLHCLQILYSMKCRLPESTVCLYQNRYYLILQSAFLPKSRFYYTIAEFADSSRMGRLLPAFLLEHAAVIAQKHAIEKIGSAFSGHSQN